LTSIVKKRIVFLAGLLLVGVLFGQNDTSGYHKTADGALKAWIYFKDKGPAARLQKISAEQLLTPRALQRRAKIHPGAPLTDYSDYPVYRPYIDAIRPFVKRLRAASRWLNAVSVNVERDSLQKISSQDFVAHVAPVHVYTSHFPQPLQTPTQNALFKNNGSDTLIYGTSLDQLEQIGVPFLHQKGLSGKGVLICMLDDGFNLWKLHRTFDSLHVVKTWDFINQDESVDDSELKAYIGWHGTMTLSAIAGYTQRELIGPAYGASFLLARTELDGDEIQAEEDYWVAGLEWADSLGADVVSSSLGYIDWYTWQDMDGATAVTTIAADQAAAKGIVVVNSAGNEGDNPNYNTLVAPADGRRVLTIGAVDRQGYRAGFSSVGPTADGRIKPDVMAMGVGVKLADYRSAESFAYGNGTSFSCPLTAGSVALLLEAFPAATPNQIIKTLHETASQAGNPDKYYGWGIVNLQSAYPYLDSLMAAGGEDNWTAGSDSLKISQNAPNPASSINGFRTTFKYSVTYPSLVEIRLFNVLGEKVCWLGARLAEGGREIDVTTDLSDLASGIYFYRVTSRTLGTGNMFFKTGKLVVVH